MNRRDGADPQVSVDRLSWNRYAARATGARGRRLRATASEPRHLGDDKFVVFTNSTDVSV
jgi:hypothetical protein